MSKRPNVLFIISDQHNAKVLGHVGHPDVKTPNLDRLASEGTRFHNAITQNPICSPSRVSFLSGQYCHNHGYYGNNGPNPGALPNVLGRFRSAGYRTAAIGKIHCPAHWVEDDCDRFDEVYENCSIGGRSAYSDYLKAKGIFDLRDDARNYDALGEGTDQQWQFDGRVSRLDYEDCVEAWIARESIGFMKQSSNEGRPFIIQASLPRPHARYTPSEPFWSMYDEASIHLPPNADSDMSMKAPNMLMMARKFRTGAWTIYEPRTFESGRLRKLHGYLGCVSQVDHAVGQMLDWLDEAGLADDTIVVYTSDHGDYACEHDIMEKAPGIGSDAITRVPFIWRWPGKVKEGHLAGDVVEAVDLPTTLCSLAGLEAMATSDGRDLSEQLKGETGDPDRLGVTEFAWSKSVRKGRFRLVHYPREMFADRYQKSFGELYDLEEDPWEKRNLFFNPEYQEIVHELRDDLLNWLITTTRPRDLRRDEAGRQIGDGKIPPSRFKPGGNYL